MTTTIWVVTVCDEEDSERERPERAFGDYSSAERWVEYADRYQRYLLRTYHIREVVLDWNRCLCCGGPGAYERDYGDDY